MKTSHLTHRKMTKRGRYLSWSRWRGPDCTNWSIYIGGLSVSVTIHDWDLDLAEGRVFAAIRVRDARRLLREHARAHAQRKPT